MRECISLLNSIHPSIQVTGDIPANYDDKCLRTLDLRVWIREIQEEINKIATSHCMKDVSTRAVISSRSSHPIRMKKSAMMNKVMRILGN